MEPRVVIVEDWPPPDTVESALLILDASKVMVGYGTGDGEFAVVTFRGGCDIKEGGPNDETLSGHPLYRYGLKHYSIHRIENSPWLQDLERQNSVHPAHSARALSLGKSSLCVCPEGANRRMPGARECRSPGRGV
jgi:hypothetical protein